MGTARLNFVEKIFTGGSKTAKFVNVFSLKSFALYGISGSLPVSSVGTYLESDSYFRVAESFVLINSGLHASNRVPSLIVLFIPSKSSLTNNSGCVYVHVYMYCVCVYP